MIHLTEDLLKALIVEEFSRLRNNPDLLDRNFIQGSKSSLSRLKKYLENRENKLYIEHGYPREPTRVPCICIILGGETSSPEGLGSNLIAESRKIEVSYLEEKSSEYWRENNSVVVKASNYPITKLTITNSKGSTLGEDDCVKKYLEQGIIIPKKVSLVYGEKYTLDYSYISEAEEIEGMQFDVNYRIEVYSDNADMNVILYSVVKYALLRSVRSLEEEGYRLINISGTDFEPLPDYFPSVFLYRRSILFSAKVVDYITEPASLIDSVKTTGTTYNEV